MSRYWHFHARIVACVLLVGGLQLAGCASRPTGVLTPVAETAPSASKVEMMVTTTRSHAANPGEMFSGERWDRLKGKGARLQRPLWASTSTKNPAYRDVIYVEELIGPDTVNTMPRETVEAFQDHGEVRNSLEEDVDGARRTLEAFAAAGIDYDDVVETLEREGVEKFSDSFRTLREGIDAKRAALVA